MRPIPTILLTVLLAILGCAATATAAPDSFASLKARLVRDGFSARQVTLAYQPAPTFQLKTVSATFRLREGQLNYDQFLAPAAIARAKRFRDDHEALLRKAQTTYGVDPNVVVAILLVETQFGSYTGSTPTLAILSTFAVMDEKANRDRVWALLSPKDRQRWDREAFDRKLNDRADWAYKELCALLKWSDLQAARADAFKGSVMGAVGWAQFLPSSLLRFGVDGNGDGRIDLFQPADAILSVAHYLREHGWCEAKGESDREAVIYTYNRSRPYIRTVLGVASRLRESGVALN